MLESSRLKIDYLSLRNIFVFLNFYFLVVPFLFTLTFESTIAIVIVCVGFLAFFVGYSHQKYLHFRMRLISNHNSMLFFVLSLIFMSHDILSGVLSLRSSNSTLEYTSSFEVTDHDSLYSQIIELVFISIKYYSYSVIMAKGRFIFYLVFISQIIFYISSPTRLVAFYPFIVFTIYGYYMGYIKVSFFRVFILTIISPVVFVILLLSRGEADKGFMERFDFILKSLDYDRFLAVLKIALESFRSFDDLVKIINEQFVHLESGVLRLFFMPISRSYWGDKPESISRLISQEYNPMQYVHGGGSVATIYGDAFINGHVLGVVIILFFLGGISRVLYNTLHKLSIHSNCQTSTFILFYSIYIYNFLYFFRGFFSESYWKVIITAFVFYSLHVLTYRVGYKRHINI